MQISGARFGEIARAKKVHSALFDIEESFGLLAESYLQIEEFLFTSSIDHYFRSGRTGRLDTYIDSTRNALNLRLLSFLSAAGAYKDHSLKRSSALQKRNATTIPLKLIFSEIFDESIEYRVMDSLRNHSVHHDLPIDLITYNISASYPSGRYKAGQPMRKRVTFNPVIKSRALAKNKKINRNTRLEMSAIEPRFLDLKFFLRGYVSLLYAAHDKLRQHTETLLTGSIDSLSLANSELAAIKGGGAKAVCATSYDGDSVDEKLYIETVRILQIQERRKDWRALRAAQSAYFSTEILSKKDVSPVSHSSIWLPE